MLNYIYRLLRFFIFGRFDNFLKNATGVIHIGANVGQEREHYKKLGVKSVVWIEADPDVYKILLSNIKQYKNYKAYNFLVTDKDNKKYTFNISNNTSNSSSIFKLKQHKIIYPDIQYKKKIVLISQTLKKIIVKKNINLNKFKFLVLDVQASELKVLKGAKDVLDKFQYIKLESSEFDLYQKNPLHSEISRYLSKLGFIEVKKITTARNSKRQKTYDVLYRNLKFNN